MKLLLHPAAKQIVAVLFVFGFLFTQPVYAQTAQEQYRNTLIQLIELLQAQIAELQQQLESRQNQTSETGLLDEIEGELVASYAVNNMQLPSSAPRSYQRYLDRIEELFPDQYDDHITELVVFTDGDLDVDAYVETIIPYDGSWRYAVRESEIKEDPYDDSSTELMIHEFAHVWSLDEVFAAGLYDQSCHSYFDDVCYGSDSHQGAFIDQFWDYQMLTDLEAVREGGSLTQDEFYEIYKSQFVSDYAATDPAEDFAESFVWYVLGESTNTSDAERKVDFFDQFDFTRTLASEIKTGI